MSQKSLEFLANNSKSSSESETKRTTNWKSIYILALVGFLAMLEMAASNEWNYFCKLDSSATVTFYGILRTVGAISTGICILLAGWICNKLHNTKQALVLSQVLVFIAYCFYLGVELVHNVIFYGFFIAYKLFLGVAHGAGSQVRTHIAMASTEEDRSKAVALCSLVPAIGLLLGFLINAGTSFLNYPGPQVPLIGIHLNMFTAPMLFAMTIFLVALYMLVFQFDGRWHRSTGEQRNGRVDSLKQAWIQPIEVEHRQPLLSRVRDRIRGCFCSQKFDWVAIGVCCFTQLVLSLSILVLTTISAPFQQIAFKWDAAQLQFYGGILGALVAVQLVLWPTLFMAFGLGKIIPERVSVMLSLSIMLFGYLVTYSWPFLPDTIEYGQQQSLDGTNSTLQSVCGQGTAVQQIGCPANYAWCATTTKPNVILYMLTFVLCMGASMPILRINLDTLYSKVLGDIKQGVMQSIFAFCTSIFEIAGGSIAISWIFEATGPKHLWEAVILLLSVCLALWLIFNKRMISSTERKAAPSSTTNSA